MDNYWAHNIPIYGHVPANPNPLPSQRNLQPSQPPHNILPGQYAPIWNTEVEIIDLTWHQSLQNHYQPAYPVVPSQSSAREPQYTFCQSMQAPANPPFPPMQHSQSLERREPPGFRPGLTSNGVQDNPTCKPGYFDITHARRAPSPHHPIEYVAAAPPPVPVLAPAQASPPPPHPIPCNCKHQAPNHGSDSDSSMPDAQEILSSCSLSSSQSKQGRAPKQTARSTQAVKSKSKALGKAKATEDDSAAKWSEEDWDSLFTFILDTKERNFLRAEKKTNNQDFWDMVLSVGLEGKWDSVSARTHWRLGRTIYSIIHQLESFTGGNGDGNKDTQFNNDDDKTTALEKIQQRLEKIQSQKPNINPHCKIKPKIYYNWVQGGDDSWFKDAKTTFAQEIEHGSGQINNSDDSGHSKSDSPPSSRHSKPKQKRSDSSVDGIVTIAKDLHNSQKAATNVNAMIAKQRLDFEKERAQIADAALLKKANFDEKLLNFKIEAMKRKWANEEKAHNAEEAAKRRREDKEDKQQQQSLVLDQIKVLEALISKPNTDLQLKETLQTRVGVLLEKLGS
ncbi:hypothetical protein RHS03_08058, partial [Rhizoctonia solani]